MKNLLIAVLMLFSLSVFAQDEEAPEKPKGFDPTNLFTGGSVTLSLGGYSGGFIAGLNPHFGYTVAKWIDFAAVVNFQYSAYHDQYNNKYRSTIYGGGVFTRIYPVKFIFVQAQPEYNWIKYKGIPSVGTSQVAHVHAPSLLVGGGYTTSRSNKNTFTYLSILVDVIKDANSPYTDNFGNLVPIIRAGINIGLGGHKNKK